MHPDLPVDPLVAATTQPGTFFFVHGMRDPMGIIRRMIEPRPSRVKVIGKITHNFRDNYADAVVVFVRNGVKVYNLPVTTCMVKRTTDKLVTVDIIGGIAFWLYADGSVSPSRLTPAVASAYTTS